MPGWAPTPSQELLLRAALLHGPAALEAWNRWKAGHDLIETPLDDGSLGLLPLVYTNLVAHRAPEPLTPRLKGIYRYWRCSNQRLRYEAATIIATLQEAGIGTLLLNGTALSTLFYRDSGLRPMANVDVLVPFRQAAAAVASLARVGWQPASGRTAAEDIRYRGSTPMVNGPGRHFRLHWHVLRECTWDDADDAFWQRSVPARLLHVSSRALDPTDALLHTIVRGTRWHEEPAIRWIPDALVILRAPGHPIEWTRLRDEARPRSLLLPLTEGLGYLQRTWAGPIPPAVFARLQEARPGTAERVAHRLALGATGGARIWVGRGLLLGLAYLRGTAGRRWYWKIGGLVPFLRYQLRGRSDPAIVALRRVASPLLRWFAPRPVSRGST